MATAGIPIAINGYLTLNVLGPTGVPTAQAYTVKLPQSSTVTTSAPATDLSTLSTAVQAVVNTAITAMLAELTAMETGAG